MILYTSSHTTSKLYLRAILTIFAHLSEKITQKRINYVVPDLYLETGRHQLGSGIGELNRALPSRVSGEWASIVV